LRSTIAKAMMNIAKQEELDTTVAEMESNCEKNGNDIRSLLNSLQFGSSSSKDSSLRLDIFSATGRVFGSASLEEKMEAVFTDFGMISLMVAEGYVGATGRGVDAMDRCAEAALSLGQHDLLDKRIHQSQAWGLLPASVLSVVGTAVHAGGSAPSQLFPSWLGKQSKRSKHLRLHRSLRDHGRFGDTAATLDARSLCRMRLFRSGRSGPEVVDELMSLGLTRDDMMETLVDTVFPGDESTVQLDSKTKGAITREWKKREGDRIVHRTVEEEGEEDIYDSEEDREMD